MNKIQIINEDSQFLLFYYKLDTGDIFNAFVETMAVGAYDKRTNSLKTTYPNVRGEYQTLMDLKIEQPFSMEKISEILEQNEENLIKKIDENEIKELKKIKSKKQFKKTYEEAKKENIIEIFSDVELPKEFENELIALVDFCYQQSHNIEKLDRFKERDINHNFNKFRFVFYENNKKDIEYNGNDANLKEYFGRKKRNKYFGGKHFSSRKQEVFMAMNIEELKVALKNPENTKEYLKYLKNILIHEFAHGRYRSPESESMLVQLLGDKLNLNSEVYDNVYKIFKDSTLYRYEFSEKLFNEEKNIELEMLEKIQKYFIQNKINFKNKENYKRNMICNIAGQDRISSKSISNMEYAGKFIIDEGFENDINMDNMPIFHLEETIILLKKENYTEEEIHKNLIKSDYIKFLVDFVVKTKFNNFKKFKLKDKIEYAPKFKNSIKKEIEIIMIIIMKENGMDISKIKLPYMAEEYLENYERFVKDQKILIEMRKNQINLSNEEEISMNN